MVKSFFKFLKKTLILLLVLSLIIRNYRLYGTAHVRGTLKVPRTLKRDDNQ